MANYDSENYTLEDIHSAFKCHAISWKYDFQEADDLKENVSNLIMEPLVLRYRAMQKLMIEIKLADPKYRHIESRCSRYSWEKICDQIWAAHRWYKKGNGHRYDLDAVAPRFYSEEDFPTFPQKFNSFSMENSQEESDGNEEPLDPHEPFDHLNEEPSFTEDINASSFIIQETNASSFIEEEPKSFFVNFAEPEGNECLQPSSDSVKFEYHHTTFKCEENETLNRGASTFSWTEHHSDPPLPVTDGKETVPNAIMVSMNDFSVDEPLYSHVSDPPDFNNCLTSAAEENQIYGNHNKHLFKHVSDPPDSNDWKTFDMKNVPMDGKNKKLLFKHVSDPPIVAMKITNFFKIVGNHLRWTDTKCMAKFWICSSCYYTPSNMYHRWKMKIGKNLLSKSNAKECLNPRNLMINFSKAIFGPSQSIKIVNAGRKFK